jgi:glucans biosynthesis protein
MGHARNTTAMHQSMRCGARTRKGAPCQAPAVKGKTRCRMHGGARGSGAPAGNQNRLCHGLYGQENIAKHRAVMDLIRRSEALLADLT